MANLKIKLEYEKGRRRGIPLWKLVTLSDNTLKSFDMTFEDIGVPRDKKGWVAVNFSNHSIAFDCEYEANLTHGIVREYNRLVRDIVTKPHEAKKRYPCLRRATIIQYSKIAENLEQDESVSLGVYTNGTKKPKWVILRKADAIAIADELSKMAEYYGQIQGVVHSFFKEADPPYLVIRELSSKNLIKCSFESEMYSDVISSMKDRQAIIFIEGQVCENMATGTVESMRVQKVYLAPDFSSKDFEDFFGCCPELTGEKTTEEYIAGLRAHER